MALAVGRSVFATTMHTQPPALAYLVIAKKTATTLRLRKTSSRCSTSGHVASSALTPARTIASVTVIDFVSHGLEILMTWTVFFAVVGALCGLVAAHYV